MPCIKLFANLLKPYMDTIRESEPKTWEAIYIISFPESSESIEIPVSYPQIRPVDSDEDFLRKT